MFGTLSYDLNYQEPVFEANEALPDFLTKSSTRVNPIHKACELCRTRKVNRT